ncbi:MAG: hypothetical protein QOJ27_201 [Sphingomonadales bacterium]|nr:hypothetical protein [Sphingomonadales bacterium]
MGAVERISGGGAEAGAGGEVEELAAGHDRQRAPQLAVGDVEVGPADGAGGDLDQQLARSGRRRRRSAWPASAESCRFLSTAAAASVPAMSKPVLFDYFRSSASYRVRIALNLKGIDHERRPVSLLDGAQKAADYVAVNPQGLVPSLEIDGHLLTQSLAIISYLDETRPQPPLLPADAADAAHVRALALAVACDIHPLNNLRVLHYLKGPLGQEQAARDDWYRHWIAEGFAALEAMAAPRAGRFLFGDAPTLADVCLVPQMFNARRLDTPLEAFAAAHPDAIADSA